MSLSVVSSQFAIANTLAMPTHQADDLIVGWALKNTITAPSIPGGWDTMHTSSGGGNSLILGCKYAASGSETFGTWTNANAVGVVVVRGDTGFPVIIPSAAAGANSLTISYSTLILRYPTTSLVVAALIFENLLSDSENAHNGLTQLATGNNGTEEYTHWAGFPGALLSDVVATGTAALHRWVGCEIREVGTAGGGGGQGIAQGLHGIESGVAA